MSRCVSAIVHLQALSGDARLLHALHRRRVRGRVHSVFRRTVNIETIDGALCTLATRDCGNAPETLVVDAGDFRAVGIAPRDSVTSADGALEVGGCRIAAASASRWLASLPPYPIDDSRLRVNVAAMRQQLRAHALCADDGIFAARARAVLDARASALGVALASGESDRARALAASMLGLGPGLTPSGDDTLVGLLAALNLPAGPGRRARTILATIIEQAETRTNAISAAALRAAAQGRVCERVVTLLDAVISGGAGARTRALRRVLAIGSTSGGDLASGIVCGFDTHLAARMRAG
jgi:uncharacterized protein DUF2877